MDVDVAWVVGLFLGFPVDDDDDSELWESREAGADGRLGCVCAEEVPTTENVSLTCYAE
jgi:hypothetical protein